LISLRDLHAVRTLLPRSLSDMLIRRCCKVDWNSSSWRTRSWRVCELDDEYKICNEQTENLQPQFTHDTIR